jgi:hypothetical protein
VGVNVDGHVIPVLPLVDVYVHAGTRVILFHDDGTSFLHYDRRRRGGRGCVGRSGSHWRGRLLTTGDSE